MDEDIKRDVATFICSHIDSVEQLEILLQQGLCWFSSEKNSFQYVNRSQKLHSVLESLVVAYRTHKYRVIDLIFTKSRSAIITFAEAFRIRKKNEEDG